MKHTGNYEGTFSCIRRERAGRGRPVERFILDPILCPGRDTATHGRVVGQPRERVVLEQGGSE